MISPHVSKKLASVLLVIATAIPLSGCVKGATPLPYAQRYQYIHQTEEALDLDTAGEVGEKIYDDNDGVFNESYIKTEVVGSETYSIVNERLKNIATASCRDDNDQLVLECGVGQVLVKMQRDSLESPIVYIKISDRYSGQDTK